MKVSVIGVGYVGLVSGVGLAEFGNSVICADIDRNKIENLKSGIIPIYEPGLKEILDFNFKAGRLQFSADIEGAIQASDVVFIAVGTPAQENGEANLSYIFDVAGRIGEVISDYKVIVVKSTVPVGTCDQVERTISAGLARRSLNVPFDVVSNPEFLKEGAAVDDFLRPDRIIIGTTSEMAKRYMDKVYKPFFLQSNRMIYMDRKSSEITKYAANAMLATRISFMNELARLCERAGADIRSVRVGIGSDPRIGSQFIYAGLGYGGSCFPKDVQALLHTSGRFGVDLGILQAVHRANEFQGEWFLDKILESYGNQVLGKVFALWGLAFKPGTDDVRESPAIILAKRLLNLGARIRAYDPVAIENARFEFSGNQNIQFVADEYEASQGADALIVATEWREFRTPNFARLLELMNRPVIFDGRNLYSNSELKDLGFSYNSIGTVYE